MDLNNMKYFIEGTDTNYNFLLHKIGEIHTNNFDELDTINVIDNGMTSLQTNELSNIKKLNIIEDSAEINLYVDEKIDFLTYKKNLNNINRFYKVSVITAIGKMDTYKKFIPTYFEGIQQQEMFDEIEFIIVYSEWDSIFEKYTNLKNVKFIKESKPINMYYAWNDGIKNSTSEYITNWNIDDIRVIQNNKIKHDFLKENIDIDMVYNYHTLCNEKELETINLKEKQPQPVMDNFHEYATSFCMGGPDPMWRKSSHLVCGLFDYENYSIIADWEMWIRMASKGLKFKLIPYILCLYVNHEETVSRTNKDKSKQQVNRLKEQYKF